VVIVRAFPQQVAAKNGFDLHFIKPGNPVQNACIESCKNRFRDER